MDLRPIVSAVYTVPACILTTGVLIGVSFCCLPFDRRGTAGTAIFRFWARAILAICRIRVRYHGLERIDPRKRYICAANHASLIDIPALAGRFPLALSFLAKEELFHIPVMGLYMRRYRHIPVVRGNSRSAVRGMAEAARTIAESERSVVVFPEGTRSEGRLGEFKDGAALLAIRSGASLLPIAIAGTSELWPARTELTTRLRNAIAGLLEQPDQERKAG